MRSLSQRPSVYTVYKNVQRQQRFPKRNDIRVGVHAVYLYGILSCIFNCNFKMFLLPACSSVIYMRTYVLRWYIIFHIARYTPVGITRVNCTPCTLITYARKVLKKMYTYITLSNVLLHSKHAPFVAIFCVR